MSYCSLEVICLTVLHVHKNQNNLMVLYKLYVEVRGWNLHALHVHKIEMHVTVWKVSYVEGVIRGRKLN